MASPAPERHSAYAEREIRQNGVLTPVVARLAASGSGDMRYINPSINFPISEHIMDAVGQRYDVILGAQYKNIPIGAITEISNDQRNIVSQNLQREGYQTADAQLDTWLDHMEDYLTNVVRHDRNLAGILVTTYGITIADGPHLRQQLIDNLWNPYLKNGSNITGFLNKLNGNRQFLTADPQQTELANQRLEIIRPMLGIFGLEETVLLTYDAALAANALEIPRDRVAVPLLNYLSMPLTVSQRNALQLLWAKVGTSQQAGEEEAMQQNSSQGRQRNTVPPVTPPPSSDQPPSQGSRTATPDENGGEEAVPMPPERPTEGGRAGGEERRGESPEGEQHDAARTVGDRDQRSQERSAPLERDIPDFDRGTVVEDEANLQGNIQTSEFIFKRPEDTNGKELTMVEKIGDGEGVSFAILEGENRSRTELVREYLRRELALLGNDVPTIRSGLESITNALSLSMPHLSRLDRRDHLGTVRGIIGITCKDGDKNALVSVRIGDAVLYEVDPITTQVERLTSDPQPSDPVGINLATLELLLDEKDALLVNGWRGDEVNNRGLIKIVEVPDKSTVYVAGTTSASFYLGTQYQQIVQRVLTSEQRNGHSFHIQRFIHRLGRSIYDFFPGQRRAAQRGQQTPLYNSAALVGIYTQA